MQMESNLPPGESLRRAMRHWVTGVSIVTSRVGDVAHGMTVNSFTSISLEPPLVTVTMNNDTRTHRLVMESGVFGVTMLSQMQLELAERFAGRADADIDRMAGLDTFALATGAPLIRGGLAFIDCRVVYRYPMLHSTLFIGEVVAADAAATELTAPPVTSGETPHNPAGLEPLVYHNRAFRNLR